MAAWPPPGGMTPELMTVALEVAELDEKMMPGADGPEMVLALPMVVAEARTLVELMPRKPLMPPPAWLVTVPPCCRNTPSFPVFGLAIVPALMTTPGPPPIATPSLGP